MTQNFNVESLGCDGLDRVQTLLDEVGDTVSKHDIVTTLITALIDEGIRAGNVILRYIAHFGFNPRHGAIVLRTGTGADPKASFWSRDEGGLYANHW